MALLTCHSVFNFSNDLFNANFVGIWLFLTGILDDDNADTLMNVNMLDDEFAKKNLENKKKKVEYKPYDEAEEDEYGMVL